MRKQKLLIGAVLVFVTIVLLFFAISKPTTTNENTEAQQPTEELATTESKQESEVSYTIQEVATHDEATDCWTIVDDIVYNITDYVAKHPGGEIIATICGRDGTEDFKNQGAPKELADNIRQQNGLPADTEFHSPDARSVLSAFELGPLESSAE